ncbi:hypothetical protein J2Y68_000578 [Paenarthrobacter nitroguajacolicus]|nr:hypothetical protein [Paenarthrobacter nitroguajacolicus]
MMLEPGTGYARRIVRLGPNDGPAQTTVRFRIAALASATSRRLTAQAMGAGLPRGLALKGNSDKSLIMTGPSPRDAAIMTEKPWPVRRTRSQ